MGACSYQPEEAQVDFRWASGLAESAPTMNDLTVLTAEQRDNESDYTLPDLRVVVAFVAGPLTTNFLYFGLPAFSILHFVLAHHLQYLHVRIAFWLFGKITPSTEPKLQG